MSRINAIREAVRSVTHLGDGPDASRLAGPEDAPALLAFLSDPAVHAPIYTLPRPLTEASVEAFITDHLAQQADGEGLLFVREDRHRWLQRHSGLAALGGGGARRGA